MPPQDQVRATLREMQMSAAVFKKLRRLLEMNVESGPHPIDPREYVVSATCLGYQAESRIPTFALQNAPGGGTDRLTTEIASVAQQAIVAGVGAITLARLLTDDELADLVALRDAALSLRYAPDSVQARAAGALGKVLGLVVEARTPAEEEPAGDAPTEAPPARVIPFDSSAVFATRGRFAEKLGAPSTSIGSRAEPALDPGRCSSTSQVNGNAFRCSLVIDHLGDWHQVINDLGVVAMEWPRCLLCGGNRDACGHFVGGGAL